MTRHSGLNKITYHKDYAVIEAFGLKTEHKVLVDKEDVKNIVNKFGRCNVTGAGYVMNKNKLLLHRFITNCPKGLVVDHINRNPLDNRKCNLRIVTHSENLHNTKVRSNNSSGVTGVQKCNKGWRASIQINNKSYRKAFKTKKEAIAYRKELEKLYHPLGGVL